MQKKSLVIGLGISGKSAARFLLSRGWQVLATDRNPNLPETDPAVKELIAQGLELFPEAEPIDFTIVQQVVLSPGVPQSHPLCLKARELGIEILGEVELACRHIRQKMVGITGTNGKTTVTLMTAHILNACGIPARALGNVGVPLTEEILAQSADEVIVAELSSYQLETMESRVLDAGVVLNITPDHLDRYKTMESYAEAKLRMARCMKAGAPFYLFEAIPDEFPALVKGCSYKTYGYSKKNALWSDLQYVRDSGRALFPLPKAFGGRRNHDLENMMASYAVCSALGVPADGFLEALASFRKPHHRIEYVATVSGVDYYDDSKGTNIDAVIRAVQTLGGPMVLIAGGVDKGAAYTPWIAAFADQVKCVYAIGQAATKIEADLKAALPVKLCGTLEDAVQMASKAAVKGDKVLLSPGCSSFDMFRDYAHRGQEFQRLVNQLSFSGALHE